MSEKRIRELAQQSVYESGLSGYIEEALADDPDVVKAAMGLRDESNVPTWTPDVRWAFNYAASLLQEVFGFRLTADGWEWTDDLTAAEAFAPEIEQSGDAE